jgi:IclR family transcriptional regulator, acetate operon repressor
VDDERDGRDVRVVQSVPHRAPRVRQSEIPLSGTLSAVRVADVLTLFLSAPGPLGVSEIATQLEMSKAVVHRILQSLASRLLVVPTSGDRRYRLGPMANAIGARALQTSDLLTCALPILRSLARETQETVTVSQLVGDRRCYIAQVQSPHEIRMAVDLGRPFPLHAGGSGRAMLAFCDSRLRDEVLAEPLAAMTSTTIIDVAELMRRLDQVRREGFAVSSGERQTGASSVAAPVFDHSGSLVGAVSVCGPTSRLDVRELERRGPLVRAAARELSARIARSASASAGTNRDVHTNGHRHVVQRSIA